MEMEINMWMAVMTLGIQIALGFVTGLLPKIVSGYGMAVVLGSAVVAGGAVAFLGHTLEMNVFFGIVTFYGCLAGGMIQKQKNWDFE